MSETDQPPAWQWQGFFGPMALATAAKASTDADPRAGVRVPLAGEAPRAVDRAGAMGMFAVQTRPDDAIACPSGLLEADPLMVGRMIGA
jgi:hypothetical protein